MKKILLVTLSLALLIFALMFVNHQNNGNFANSNDYFFHFERAKGKCFLGNGLYTEEKCKNYPPFLGIISSPFSQNQVIYNIFLLGILLIIIPLIICFKTKSMWSILIYFSSSYVYNTLYASIFSQMIIVLLVVLLLYNEKFKPIVDIPILIIANFTHNEGIYAIIPIIIYKIFKDKIFFPKAFLFTTLIEKKLDFSSMFKLGPIINWFYTFKLSIAKILLIFFFIICGFIFDFRTILFVPVLWAYWLPEKILENKNKMYKIILGVSYVCWIFFEIFIWFRDIYAL